MPKVVLTAYADAGTAVALGLSGVLGWMLLEALAENDAAKARRLTWQLGLAATALVNLKQINILLLGAMLVGVLLAGWLDRRVRLAPLIRLVALSLIAPVAVFVMWQLYVSLNIVGGGHTVVAFAEWRFDLMWDTLARMALIASKKGGYFGLMLVAIVFAVRATLRPGSRIDSLALIVASTFIIYNGALFFAYITAFGEYEARRAASFWRYNMHLGGLALVFAAYGLALLWRYRPASWARVPFGGIAVALIVALPFVLSTKLRIDDRPPKHYVRAVGDEMAGILPAGTRLAIIDPAQDGFYGVLLRYALHQSADIVAWFTAFSSTEPKHVRSVLEKKAVTHVWVHVSTPDVEAALRTKLPEGSSYLLKRNGSAWTVERSWAYPGYRHPGDLPD